MIQIRARAKYCLEQFLKDPSEETLESFLHCWSVCLLGTICLRGSLPQQSPFYCPGLCDSLSDSRLAATHGYSRLCTGDAYRKVWRTNPADLIISLTQLNAYIETLIEDEGKEAS